MIFDDICSKFNDECDELDKKYPKSLSQDDLEKEKLIKLRDILKDYDVRINEHKEAIQNMINYAEEQINSSNKKKGSLVEQIEYTTSSMSAIIIFFAGYILSILTKDKFLDDSNVSRFIYDLIEIAGAVIIITYCIRVIVYFLKKFSEEHESKHEVAMKMFIKYLKHIQMFPEYVLTLKSVLPKKPD